MATSTNNISNAEYHALTAISKSSLDLINKSVSLLEWSKQCPQAQNDTADIGNAVHCALLEPERFADEYRKMPNIDKRTNAGKAQAEEFTAACAGKIVLSADDFDMITAMRDSALAHPIARALLTEKGVSELSIFGEISGVKVKIRPDRINYEREMLVDVKTTDDIDKFHFSVRDYRYHVQDAFYTDVHAQLNDGKKWPFVFVVIGKRRVFGRHPVRVFQLTDEDREMGRAEYLQNIETYKETLDFGAGFDIETIAMAKTYK